MDDDEHHITRLQADVKNICRTMDEVKASVEKIKDSLSEHRVLSAERAAAVNHIATQVSDHEGRIKKLETSFVKLAFYVALGAGGATLGIDKILDLLKS